MNFSTTERSSMSKTERFIINAKTLTNIRKRNKTIIFCVY